MTLSEQFIYLVLHILHNKKHTSFVQISQYA